MFHLNFMSLTRLQWSGAIRTRIANLDCLPYICVVCMHRKYGTLYSVQMDTGGINPVCFNCVAAALAVTFGGDICSV